MATSTTKPADKRAKHDWTAITTQFLLCDHADFRAFLTDMGYPHSLMKSPQSRHIAEKKRGIMEAQAERVRQAMLVQPMVDRENRKMRVLKELSDSARALRSTVMNRLVADLHLTQRAEGESVAAWVAKINSPEVKMNTLRAGELMALAVAQKHADDLIRKAEGLEDFDWENEERKQKAIAKSEKLQFEIVMTSNATPIDQLPHAAEDEQSTG